MHTYVHTHVHACTHTNEQFVFYIIEFTNEELEKLSNDKILDIVDIETRLGKQWTMILLN